MGMQHVKKISCQKSPDVPVWETFGIRSNLEWSPENRLAKLKPEVVLFYSHLLSDSLSFHFNGHFPGGPGLAGAGLSPFWILLELRVMEMVVTMGDIRRAKLQSKCYHQQTNTQFFTGRMPCQSPMQQCHSTSKESIQ